MNKIIIIGNLTKNPETKPYGNEGKTMCIFSIADNNGFGDKKTVQFFNCTAFGKTGEAISKFMVKGSKMFVDGRLEQKKYTSNKDGTEKTAVSIIVNDCHFLDPKRVDVGGEPAPEFVAEPEQADVTPAKDLPF